MNTKGLSATLANRIFPKPVLRPALDGNTQHVTTLVSLRENQIRCPLDIVSEVASFAQCISHWLETLIDPVRIGFFRRDPEILLLNVFNELFSLRVGERVFTLKFNTDDVDFCFRHGGTRRRSGVKATLRLGIPRARQTQGFKQNQNAETEVYSAAHA